MGVPRTLRRVTGRSRAGGHCTSRRTSRRTSRWSSRWSSSRRGGGMRGRAGWCGAGWCGAGWGWFTGRRCGLVGVGLLCWFGGQVRQVVRCRIWRCGPLCPDGPDRRRDGRPFQGLGWRKGAGRRRWLGRRRSVGRHALGPGTCRRWRRGGFAGPLLGRRRSLSCGECLGEGRDNVRCVSHRNEIGEGRQAWRCPRNRRWSRVGLLGQTGRQARTGSLHQTGRQARTGSPCQTGR